MFKSIKKFLIILILITMKAINYIITIIQKSYRKNKSKIEKFANSFYTVLKEELSK